MNVLNHVIIHLIFLLLIFCAILSVKTKDLIASVINYASYSLLMCILWLLLASPDVALTEAALGAAVTTMLMITTIGRTRRFEK